MGMLNMRKPILSLVGLLAVASLIGCQEASRKTEDSKELSMNLKDGASEIFNLKGKDHCTAVLKFYTTNSPESDEMAEPERLLTTVTLKFKGDATGIESVKVTESNTSNEVWTVQGTFVGRNITNLNSLPKGLYLVRQNGKTTKVAVGQ